MFMQKISVSIIFSVLFFFQINAQCTSQRYQNELFPNVTRTNNVVFGNAKNYLGINQDLKMDIYEPTGDVLAYRPLVIWMFGGGFLLGSRTDADVTAWSERLAKHGYVCASADYRLGMVDINSEQSAERAAYRAGQDAASAVRYLKHHWQQYRIDTTKIIVAGESAGAFNALNVAFTDEDERPASSYGFGLFENFDLGCVNCSGNNYTNRSDDVFGVIDLWGAIRDVNWIDANERVPVLLIHGDADNIVPYDEGKPFTFGPFSSNFPYVYGSVKIAQQLNALGIYNEFYTYEGQNHLPYGIPTITVTFPTEYWEPIFMQGKNFLWSIQQFQTPAIQGSSSVCVNDTRTYTVNTSRPNSTFCWNVNGGTILQQNGNQITVQWTSTTGQLSCVEMNRNMVAGAVSNLAVQIHTPATPQITTQALTNTIIYFNNQTSGSNTYLWNFGDGQTSALPSPTHTFGNSGTYNVVVTITNNFGCTSTASVPVTIGFTGITDNVSIDNIVTLTPNPCLSSCLISVLIPLEKLEIIDFSGKIIFSDIHITSPNFEWKPNNKGLYILRYQVKNQLFSSKFIVN